MAAEKPKAAPDPFEWLKQYPLLCRKTTSLKKRLFLTIYRDAGVISVAAKQAGVDQRTHYKWMSGEHTPEEAEEYTEAFKEAHDYAIGKLELEARRRATEGVQEPIYYKGELVGHCRKYSDVLLIFLLKGAMPDKYRERVEQFDGGGVERLSDEQIEARRAELARKARASGLGGGEAASTGPAPESRIDTGGED